MCRIMTWEGSLMKPKLEKLLEKPGFGKGALDIDTGIMVYNGEALTYLTLTYPDHYKVYLSVYDDIAPNDLLIETEGSTLREAQKLAEEELKRTVNSNIH